MSCRCRENGKPTLASAVGSEGVLGAVLEGHPWLRDERPNGKGGHCDQGRGKPVQRFRGNGQSILFSLFWCLRAVMLHVRCLCSWRGEGGGRDSKGEGSAASSESEIINCMVHLAVRSDCFMLRPAG